MPADPPDPRALDLCAIGLGQAGGNLAAEWHRRGYRALLFNTARSDFKALSRHEGLGLPDHFQIHIGIGTTDGAGKDPEYGAACLKQHEGEVRAAVEAQLAGADGVLLCAGLGGGTGSALHELARILEPLELPTIAVASLPADAESGITKVNAVRAANALVQAPLHGRIFIDNERLVESFPDVDVISYYPHVNTRVLGPLDALNRLNGDPSLWSIRSFDGEDMRKVLLSGGVLQTHTERLDENEPLSAELLVDVVGACVNGGRHLASGLTLAECAYLALVIVGPERVLKETRIHVLDDAIAELKHETGGGAVYEGLYVGDDDSPLMVYVLSASLALPSRVQALLGAAHEEGGALMAKIREEIPELEISPLEGLDLFRAPTRRRTGAGRPASPKPRPLGQQLLDDPVFARGAKGAPAAAKASAPKASEPRPASAARAVHTAEESQPSAQLRVPPPAGPAPAVDAPSEATEHVARADPKDDLVPRVGTGRHDEPLEKARLEPTLQVETKKGKDADAQKPSEAPADISLPDGEPEAAPDDDSHRRRTRSKRRAERSRRSGEGDLAASDEGPAQSSRPELRPRVGTGRWDQEPSDEILRHEPTEAKKATHAGADAKAAKVDAPSNAVRADPDATRPADPAPAPAAPGRKREEHTEADQEPASGISQDLPPPRRVRAGTGRPEDDHPGEVTEAVEVSELEASGLRGLSIDGNGLFSAEDLPFEYDIEGEADEFEMQAALTRPVDDDAILAAVPDRPPPQPVASQPAVPLPEEFDADELDETHTGGPNLADVNNPLTVPTSAHGQPTVVSKVDELLLSSVVGESHRAHGTGLQNVYEDLIDRFRQAPDRRGRERVARRLIDDSRADDVEIRALAVWAMVKLEERGFRRALAKAANDANPEISKLALTGLERIGARG